MLVTLRELLPAAAANDYAVPCFNVFGNEEAIAIVAAAEALSRGVILACNKEMAEFMGVEGFYGMVSHAAKSATVPVCIHLDHCDNEERIVNALKAGFSSVMYDGSQLPLAQNISRTAAMAGIAHDFGASIEGEVGSVPYFEGRDHIKSELTRPADAQEFAEKSGVDAMAIAVGNIHRLREPTAIIDYDLLAYIEACTTLPLVIHGTTGITEADLMRLKRSRVSKFNIGTTMRMTFARSLRASLAHDAGGFDRLSLMRPVVTELQAEATRILTMLGAETCARIPEAANC
jgi:fructose-bisphosphate aldolase, class II